MSDTYEVSVQAPRPKVDLSAWTLSTGPEGESVPDEQFIRYTEEMRMRGDEAWPPSIFSYHGHPIPLPNVSIEYVGRGATFLKCLVTFKKKTLDPEIGLLVEHDYFTVPAWQGDNNLIHLMEELPGEDYRDVNMTEFYESTEDIDRDYLNRLRQYYSDEELLEKAPEVFFYMDPAQADAVAR